GTLDAFVSNTGDYFEAFLGIPGSGLGGQTSRHFFQNLDGTWTDSGVDPNLASVFGWGTAAFDYDNDGDTDIAYVGGLDVALIVESSNPGVILTNDGAGQFSYDEEALVSPVAADHVRRNEHGLAVGDLNRDGFVDFVSVSNQNVVPPIPLVPYAAAIPIPFSSPFNELAAFSPIFAETVMGSGDFVWTGFVPEDGTLAIEINSADNRNGWVNFELLGSADLTSDGVVNRNGIGGVVRFRPHRLPAATKPVMGGSSYASQNSLDLTFGMKKASRGTVDVLWPGGTRNRLYDVRKFERLLIPEIPCSYEDDWQNIFVYVRCVTKSLRQLQRAGVINSRYSARLLVSSVRAYLASR
ncbi:MAG: CRTAC1 family protein, partial [Pseudomonadota bacterium]